MKSGFYHEIVKQKEKSMAKQDPTAEGRLTDRCQAMEPRQRIMRENGRKIPLDVKVG